MQRTIQAHPACLSERRGPAGRARQPAGVGPGGARRLPRPLHPGQPVPAVPARRRPGGEPAAAAAGEQLPPRRPGVVVACLWAGGLGGVGWGQMGERCHPQAGERWVIADRGKVLWVGVGHFQPPIRVRA